VKKMSFLLAVVMVLILTAGCQGSRTPVDAVQFNAKAEEAGYLVQDASDQFDDGDVNDYLIAIKGTESIDYQIEFAVVPTEAQAISAYQENKGEFEANKGSSSSCSSVSTGNYSYYYLTTNGRYYVISRIENTFIYVDASAEYKAEISSFLKSIGY